MDVGKMMSVEALLVTIVVDYHKQRSFFYRNSLEKFEQSCGYC